MRYRVFGKTGWRVSAVSLGTVELGGDYGIYAPAESRRPSEDEAVGLLLRAFEGGVNLVDTAPAYGRSEELIGKALREWRQPVRVATKVGAGAARREVVESLERSLRRLGVGCLDLVQVHNAAAAEIMDGAVFEALEQARRQGKLLFVGASVYGTGAARAALRRPGIDALQVAYNLLDQRMDAVIAEASARGVAVLIRSAFLKGVLTDRHRHLPARFAALRRAAEKAGKWAEGMGETLPRAALRFCLARGDGASVLAGTRTEGELDDLLATVELPPLTCEALAAAEGLAVNDDALVDPRRWGTP